MKDVVARLWPHLAWIAYAAVLAIPLFVVKYPPLQDWPFHLATTRVIHSFHDPAFGFDRDFVLRLFSTQYVLYYLLATALAYALGVVGANLALVAVYLGGTVLAVRALLRALDKDERIALFVPPLLVNVMFLFGLLPYLFAIPVMFAAMAAALRHFARPRWTSGALAAVLGAMLFYLHVFPFMLFALCYAACFPWTRPREWLKAGIPAIPSVAAVAWFTFLTPEGKLARGALFHPDRPATLSPWGKLTDSFNWLGDVWRDDTDTALWAIAAALAVAAFVTGFRDKRGESRTLAAYSLVPAACIFLFCIAGEQHGHIWLIWQRFPMLFVLVVLPFLRFPTGAKGKWLTAALVALGALVTLNTAWHFRRFRVEDTDDFDGALVHMRPKARVAGLIYWKESSVTWRHPLVHFVSYYQVEKGGVVEFTFAGYPHWPFTFAEGRCPSSGCPAKQDWEWHPEQVPIEELTSYYDYVLTRGEGFAPPAGTFVPTWRGGRWTVWENRTGSHGE